jgi:hypothetical protein
VQKPAGTFLKS